MGNESVRSSCVTQVISPTSTSLELVNHLLLCRGRRKSSRRKTLLFNLWVSVLPVIYQLVKMSSWEGSHNVRWGTAQEWLSATGASCLGMSVVTFHSPDIFYPKLFLFFSKIRFVTYILLTRAVPHTWFWPGYPHIHRWDGGGVLVEMEGDGGTARDQSCQEHAKTRERCHRSTLPCHSSAYNEKIWADKGRRQTSVTAGGCQSVFKIQNRNSYPEQFSEIQKELTSSCLMLFAC